jgi:hypothetical protein
LAFLKFGDFLYAHAESTQGGKQGVEYRMFALLLMFMVLIAPIFALLSIGSEAIPGLKSLAQIEGPRGAPGLYFLAILIDGLLVLLIFYARRSAILSMFPGLSRPLGYWRGVLFVSLYFSAGLGLLFLQKISAVLCISTFIFAYVIGSVLLSISIRAAKKD